LNPNAETLQVTMEGGIRGFLMLADAMRGPNHANQLAIAQENPTPLTINPEPNTWNPKRETRSPKPSLRNHKP